MHDKLIHVDGSAANLTSWNQVSTESKARASAAQPGMDEAAMLVAGFSPSWVGRC